MFILKGLIWILSTNSEFALRPRKITENFDGIGFEAEARLNSI
jgi:hypothetical protein